MKKKQFESLCKKLLPDLSGFACRGWVLHAEPLGHVLRGFSCDPSGFDPKRFAVYVFFLPLYIPTKHLHFNMGRRLADTDGCDIWWNLSDPHLRGELLACIQRDGLPFLEGVSQPCDVVKAIQRLGADSDPYKLEAIAYSLAMTGDIAAAQQSLERLMKALNNGISWQAEMIERAARLTRTLSANPQEAHHHLANWEQTTVQNLSLG